MQTGVVLKEEAMNPIADAITTVHTKVLADVKGA